MRRRYSCLLGLSIVLAACGDTTMNLSVKPVTKASSQQISAYEKAYQEGKTHLVAGRSGLAILAFARALALDPSSVAALNAMGTAYDFLGRYDIARTYYEKALKLDPNSADSLNNMAVSLRLAGKQEARDYFAAAEHVDPANATIRANLSKVEAEDAKSAGEPVLGSAGLPARSGEAVEYQDAHRPRLERTSGSEYQLFIPASVGANEAPARELAVAPPQKRQLPLELAALVSSSASRELSTPSPALPLVRVEVASLAPPPSARAAPMPSVRETAAPTPSVPKTAAPAPAAGPHTMKLAAAPAGVAEPAHAEPRHAPRIVVANGTGRPHLAIRMRAFLAANGTKVTKASNAHSFNHAATVVFYREGFHAEATRLARMLRVAIRRQRDRAMKDDIRIVLGRDLSAFDRHLGEKHHD
jgi:tetratricopeptide (TPR) repeat protein